MATIRLVIWVVVLVAVAIGCGVAGLDAWLIAVIEAGAWLAIVVAERLLSSPPAWVPVRAATDPQTTLVPDDSSVRVLRSVAPAEVTIPAPAPTAPVMEEQPTVEAPVVVATRAPELAFEPEPAPAPFVFQPSEFKVTAPVARTREAWPPAVSQTTAEGGVRWNLWNLERLARERAAGNEELSFTLIYLREFADPEGLLPPQFDGLIRDSFGSLLSTAAAV